MSSRLTIFSYHGCLIKHPDMKLQTHIDPIGDGVDVPYNFTKTVWENIETESQTLVMSGDHEMIEGSTYTDYYGILHSVKSAVTNSAFEYHKKFNGADSIDVVVKTKICQSFGFKCAEPPFYHWTAKLLNIPKYRFKLQENSDESFNDAMTRKEAEREYIVWKNGRVTDDFYALKEFILEMIANDCGHELREDNRGVLYKPFDEKELNYA